jgi:hypothetical protein
MILNKDNILYYGNDGPELRLSSALFAIRDFDDADYWYIDFFSGEHLIDVRNNLPTNVLADIQSGKVMLLLHNSHEAFHSVVGYIYMYLVVGLSIPAEHITLLSESSTINHEVTIVANKFNLPEINTEWIRMLEYNVQVQTIASKTLNTLVDKAYRKKFLSLNRRWRLHRPMLIALLKVSGLLEQGHVSLATSDDDTDWNRIWDNLVDRDPSLTAYKDIVMSIPALYLDTTDLKANRATLTVDTDQYYVDTYFSIVTETNFYEDFETGIFLSEKIFKPISRRHPFLLLARPYTLKKLREIGYKSFGDIIDESYDEEMDDNKRMHMVLSETKRLCNLPPPELSYFLTKARETTTYNYLLLRNKRKFITKL